MDYIDSYFEAFYAAVIRQLCCEQRRRQWFQDRPVWHPLDIRLNEIEAQKILKRTRRIGTLYLKDLDKVRRVVAFVYHQYTKDLQSDIRKAREEVDLWKSIHEKDCDQWRKDYEELDREKSSLEDELARLKSSLDKVQ